ncbi:unnamed protein product, partial [Heterosigma akashiwo]
RAVIPGAGRRRLVEQVHGAGMTAHQGYRRTVSLLEQSYTWPGMRAQVYSYIRSCDACQQCAGLRQERHGYSYPTPAVPFRVLAADFTGVLGKAPASQGRFKHILVLVDLMSKFVFLEPTSGTKARDVIETLKRRVFPLCGVPSVVLSDSAACFTGHEFKDFMESVGSISHTIPRGASKANGLVERTIGTVHRHMAKLLVGSADRKGWHLRLPTVEMTMRNSPSAVSGLSAAEVCLGFRP